MTILKKISAIKKKIIKLLTREKKLIGVIGLVVLPLIAVIVFELYFWGKVFPGTKIANIYIDGLTPEQAINKLNSQIPKPEKITLIFDNQSFEIALASLDFSYEIEKSVERAYYLHRTGNFSYDLSNQLKSLFKDQDLGLRILIDHKKLQESLSVIAGQVAVDPINPSVQLVNKKLYVNKGTPGKDVDIENLKEVILMSLSLNNVSPIKITTQIVGTTISEKEAELLTKRADNIINKKISLNFEYDTFSYSENKLLSLLASNNSYYTTEIEKISHNVSEKINRQPQNAIFVFEGGRVKEFVPAKDGLEVKKEDLSKDIITALNKLAEADENSISINIPVFRTKPKVTNENVNDLGIKELIGRGTSRFRGSISSRVHNIALASSRFKGVLVTPGETLSFNKALGDVSVYTGYQQAYIIKDGKTVLGDGGGVCQVSTTLFRAVLDAGLPIVERRAHSYRVGYYEQGSPVGLDATVYAPTTDFKIKNDTPGHILIQTAVDTKNASLVFEIYGTTDGRVAKTTKPKVTNVIPPPEDLYTDDPTLPSGIIKQVDYEAWGAKVTFNYTVERDGATTFEKTFYSNYRPWQAKFLRGTGPQQ